MANNNFLAFAIGSGANVITQNSYAALPALGTGFQSGLAQSAQVNKVLRQSSLIAAVIGEFIADYSGQDALDDGNITVLENNFVLALQKLLRYKVTTPLQLYVNPSTGNDNNPGTSSGSPFKTIQAAVNAIYAKYDLNSTTATVNLADGTYAPASGLPLISVSGSPSGTPTNGLPQISFIGNNANPQAVVLNATSANCIQAAEGAFISVSGVSISASGTGAGFQSGIGLHAVNGGFILINGAVGFRTCGSWQVRSSTSSSIAFGSPYTISGGAPAHYLVDHAASIIMTTSCTVQNTPSFSNAFAVAGTGGQLEFSGASFAGSATGTRYAVSNNAVITGTGGNQTFLPGNAAGTTALGGIYS